MGATSRLASLTVRYSSVDSSRPLLNLRFSQRLTDFRDKHRSQGNSRTFLPRVAGKAPHAAANKVAQQGRRGPLPGKKNSNGRSIKHSTLLRTFQPQRSDLRALPIQSDSEKFFFSPTTVNGRASNVQRLSSVPESLQLIANCRFTLAEF